MHKILFKLLTIILLSTYTLQAQELYMPRNIKLAYHKGTRSLDGKPGKQYWQNHSQYAINLTVTPQTNIVKGTERSLITITVRTH